MVAGVTAPNGTELPRPETSVGPTYSFMAQMTAVIYLYWPFFTATIGIIGNNMSLLITTKKDNRKHSTCVYMAGLAIVDTCFEFVVSAYKIVVFHGVGKNMEENLMFLSFIWYGADAFAITSGLFLAEMSIDRAIAVTFPMKAASICTASRALKVTVVTCVIQLTFNIQAFFSYKLPDPPNGVVLRHVPNMPWVEQFLNFYQVLFGTILPFSILIICNTIIIINVRRASKKRKKMDLSKSHRKSKEPNLTALLLVTSFAYFVCSIPKRIYEAIVPAFIQYDLDDPYWGTRYWLQWWIFTEIWHLNFAINFYVYFLGGGAKFRRDAKEIFTKYFKDVLRDNRGMAMTQSTATRQSRPCHSLPSS
ncbi:C-C chemokine receptor type 3-like [Lineus longissimus]|uniref:C-C chemokine receptor type 3-like n=1 Tax=Lineus longissimus TaxID=88925 RepID=UPI00315CE4C8